MCYVAGSVLCALAPSIWVLVGGRVLQGVGQGSCVLPSAIARDLFDDVGERLRVMAFLGSLSRSRRATLKRSLLALFVLVGVGVAVDKVRARGRG